MPDTAQPKATSAHFALLGVVALLLSTTALAHVFWDPKQDVQVHVLGPITVEDAKTLEGHPRLSRGQPVVVDISSNGGDWLAALAIGKLLRKSRAAVLVDAEQQCLSACVMVLAGAVDRFVHETAKVGIHRPYSSSTESLSFEQSQQRYRALEASARSYLREMNVPDALFDAMVRVPSENMRILSAAEIETFGLTGKDPVEADVADAKAARQYGLSRQEYLSRKRTVQAKCGSLTLREDDPYEVKLKGLQTWNRCEQRVLKTGR